MLFSRETYLDLMAFGDVERPMFVELFGPLVGLEDEWKQQGATDEELSMDAFDWDYVPVVQCGGALGLFGCPEPEIIEETDSYLLEKDGLGRVLKLSKGYATLPLPMNFPVTDMASWLNIKHYFEYSPDRVDSNAIAEARKKQEEGHLVVAAIPGAFDTMRELMGCEAACMAFCIQPDLVQDILSTLADTALHVLEQVLKIVKIDQLSAHEDFAGKSGPLIGPAQVEEFCRPYFRSVWELVHAEGTTIFDVDSDGDVRPVLDALLDCGMNSLHPFEPAAGMDMVQLRKQYGDRLRIRGGIDKHVLRKSKTDILDELEYKLQPAMRTGGIAFGLDHRIPNGTPLENYRYYVEKGREILGLPPLDGTQTGWGRMAF